MYETNTYRHGVFDGRYRPFAFDGRRERGCECGERCGEWNFYGFPFPLKKEQKRLDTTQLTVHTDEFVRRDWIKKGCCPPEPVIVKDEKRSFIISAATNCLEPDTYYTMQIDRETPMDAYGLDTFIRVEPCGFYRGEVGLNYTKTIHKACFGDGIDGEPAEEEVLEVEEGIGPVPKDPAFPAQDYAGYGFKDGKGVLIPVALDLHGNLANGKNFATGRFTVPGVGRPYNNRFVLYYNNRGVFSLCRNWRRRSDYA